MLLVQVIEVTRHLDGEKTKMCGLVENCEDRKYRRGFTISPTQLKKRYKRDTRQHTGLHFVECSSTRHQLGGSVDSEPSFDMRRERGRKETIRRSVTRQKRFDLDTSEDVSVKKATFEKEEDFVNTSTTTSTS